MENIKVGMSFKQSMTVADKDSAKNLGSGSLDVFGTPGMIAWMENTALKVVADLLPEGGDTVGISISTSHTKASKIGEQITFEATITAVEGRKISYEIKAWDSKEDVIGAATHDRFVIDAERFMSKL